MSHLDHDDLDRYIRDYERRLNDEAVQREWEEDDTRILPRPRVFRCDPDESGGYELSDPKHPDHHDTYADYSDAA